MDEDGGDLSGRAATAWSRASLVAVTGFALFSLLWGGVAPAQPERLECHLEDSHPQVGRRVVVSCTYTPPPSEDIRGIGGFGWQDPSPPELNSRSRGPLAVDGEIMALSVGDPDGTAPPPDFTKIVDIPPGEQKGSVGFPLSSPVQGRQSLCIWLDRDGYDDNIDDGGACEEDDDTEVLELQWLDPRESGVSASTPPREADAGSDGAAGDGDDSIGFVLVADRELSFAIDVVLVLLAAIVLWRSRWIRLIVLETVRHPRRRATLEREGTDVVVRSADGTVT